MGCEGMDRINVAQEWASGGVTVNEVMNLWYTNNFG
jgi:hypothetical protein